MSRRKPWPREPTAVWNSSVALHAVLLGPGVSWAQLARVGDAVGWSPDPAVLSSTGHGAHSAAARMQANSRARESTMLVDSGVGFKATLSLF